MNLVQNESNSGTMLEYINFEQPFKFDDATKAWHKLYLKLKYLNVFLNFLSVSANKCQRRVSKIARN